MNKRFEDFLRNSCFNIDYLQLHKKIGKRNVYIWGADYKGEWYAEELPKYGIEISGFLDQNIENRTKSGLRIYRPTDIIYEGNYHNCFVIISMFLKHSQEIMSVLNKAGFTENDYFYPCQDWDFMSRDIGTPDSSWLDGKFTKGKEIADKLSPNKFYFLLWGGHIGDEAIALSWLWAFKEKHFLREVVVITSKLFANIAKLYPDDVNEIMVLDKEQLDALRIYTISRRRQVYNILGAYWRWIPKECGIPFPIAQTLYKTIHLGLEYHTKSKYISGYGFEHNIVKSIIEKYGIEKGKSVILIPYAKSASMLDIKFWENLVEKLSSQYKVYTNIGNDNEEPIKGTIPLCVSLEYIIDIVKYAGKAVSIRCGLTDLLALGNCNCQVLYFIESEQERIYSQVNSCYVNGTESILYKNAIYIEDKENTSSVIDEIIIRLTK